MNVLVNQKFYDLAIESGMSQYVSPNNKCLERFAYLLLDEVYNKMNDLEAKIKQDHPYIKEDVVKTECHIDLLKEYFRYDN